MQQSTIITADTPITPDVVRECLPSNPAYQYALRAYKNLVALVAYAVDNPELEDLAYLADYGVILLEDGTMALSYDTLHAVVWHEQNYARIAKYKRELDCPPWPSSGRTDLRCLTEELQTLKTWLDLKQAERLERAARAAS